MHRAGKHDIPAETYRRNILETIRVPIYLLFMGKLHRLLCALLMTLVAAGATAEPDVLLSSGLKTELLALPHVTGEPLSPDHLDGRATIVSFFASWCPPCNAEFEHLAELRAHYGTDLTIVSINVFEDFGDFKDRGARLQRFLRRHRPGHSVISGNPSIRERFGHVERIPTLYVFDREGAPVFTFIHERNASKTNATKEEIIAAVNVALQ